MKFIELIKKYEAKIDECVRRYGYNSLETAKARQDLNTIKKGLGKLGVKFDGSAEHK